MYIRKIEIKNYGCIENFNLTTNIDENGNPIPIVLIGENASGKTLLLSNIIDSFVEIKRKVFTNGISEVESNNYFKTGNKEYIRNGSDFSSVSITCSFNEKINNYIDVMSTNPQKVIDNKTIKEDIIKDMSNFLENGFFRKTTINKLKVKDYDDFIQLYFPNDRYYTPMWYNASNYTKIDYSSDTSINKGKTNLIKIDLFENINEWLRDLFLSQSIVPRTIATSNGELVKYIPAPTSLHTCINKILSVIKDCQTAKVVANRRQNETLLYLNNEKAAMLSQLSQGELFLFSIFSSIIKEWDLSHDSCNFSEITGCVVIDEADLGLHIDFLNRAFPKLMKLFPKIQFIITTHSPFLLNGLEREYEKDIDIINMPNGQKIEDVSMFSEMVEAYKIFDEKLLKTQKTIDELSKIISKSQNKKIVLTEGKTDALILKKAIEKLNLTQFESLEIKPVNEMSSDLTSNNTELKNFLEHMTCNDISNNLLIGIFDRDTKIEFKVDNVKQDIRSNDYIKLRKNVYAFALPVPHERPEKDDISIEHYFNDDEIKTMQNGKRLFLCNEFNSTGVSKDKKYVCNSAKNRNNSIKIIEHSEKSKVTSLDGTEDYSLSKSIFAENIYNDVDGFDNFNFNEFNKIFDIIHKIVEEAKD